MYFIFIVLFPIWLNPIKPLVPKSDFKIYIFVAETCPICQYYTKKIKTIEKDFGHETVLVFPNKLSNEESIEKYKRKYKIEEFEHIIDSEHLWVKKFDAMVTPEVFVYNLRQDSVYYRGRIDDNYARVGKRKLQIQSDDLVNALNAIKDKKKIEVAITQSVGCYISRTK